MGDVCPICEEEGVLNLKEEVCRNCGSLEGIVEEECARSRKGHGHLFGYKWSSGSCAPWRSNGGATAYSTPSLAATTAFEDCNFRGDGKRLCVLDLGCGDADLLCTAAKFFGEQVCCIGLEIDDNALLEAEQNAKKQNFDGRITLIKLNFMDIDLLDFLRSQIDKLGIISPSIIITAYLLPPTLERLKGAFETIFSAFEEVAVITFKWNIRNGIVCDGNDATTIMTRTNTERGYTLYLKKKKNE